MTGQAAIRQEAVPALCDGSRLRYIRAMNMLRRVVVFDAADLDAESMFWAGMFGGLVFRDDRFHCVTNAAGEWCLGVQLAPDHIPPDWPDGAPRSQARSSCFRPQ